MKKSDMICTINIKDRHGNVVGTKEVVKYEGLLARAHEEGLKSVVTELVQVPCIDNDHMAIVKAKVETHAGIFEALGDATAESVNARMAPHLIRMAETRAKARALRDAVNIGTVSIEEMVSDVDEENSTQPGNGGNGDSHQHRPTPSP